jgi:hypothetical protein
MPEYSRLIAVLLLTPLLTAMLSSQSLALPSMSAEHPAGCHENGPVTPSRAPVSYQCCVMGHHWAVPGIAYSFEHTALETLQFDSLEHFFPGSASRQNVQGGTYLSVSPPKSLPLRI